MTSTEIKRWETNKLTNSEICIFPLASGNHLQKIKEPFMLKNLQYFEKISRRCINN